MKYNSFEIITTNFNEFNSSNIYKIKCGCNNFQIVKTNRNFKTKYKNCLPI